MKALPFKIPKTSNDTLIIQEDRSMVFYDKFHQHEEIQVSLVVSGEGSLIIGDTITRYKSNDILIFGSQVPHVLKSTPSSDISYMISVFFAKDSFGDHFFQLSEFIGLQDFFECLPYGVRVLNKKENLKDYFFSIRNSKNRLDRFIIFLNMLKLFCEVEKETISSSITRKNYTDNEGKRMASVFQLVMHEFHRDITLTEVSAIATMTPNAFCRYFKQRTNKTFFQFLTEVRIENSCRLLSKESDMSIAQISYASGFKNLSNYNRKFKLIKKMTPSQFKKRLHNTHLL